MFRSHFKEDGTTGKWQVLYRALNEDQKKRLMALISLNVSELKKSPWPENLRDILPFYLIHKVPKKAEVNEETYTQMSLMDDGDVVIEDWIWMMHAPYQHG